MPSDQTRGEDAQKGPGDIHDVTSGDEPAGDFPGAQGEEGDAGDKGKAADAVESSKPGSGEPEAGAPES